VKGTASAHTTRNPEDRRLAGLHIDQLEHGPIAEFKRPMSRLSFNLGLARPGDGSCSCQLLFRMSSG